MPTRAPQDPAAFGPGDPDGDALRAAIDALHASREGVLGYGERHARIRFVTCNESGRIVMCVPEAASEVHDAVLHVPDESDGSLQLLLIVWPAEESIATDRWQVFHGAPDLPCWVTAELESARLGAWVFEGEQLTQPNILIHDEPALVRELNADRVRLRAICAIGGTPVDDPTAVGVHHHGLHVRARFGVVHVPFPQDATDAGHARRILRHMADRPQTERS